MGRGVLDVGSAPEQGNVMKLVGNFFISSWIEICSEGMTLADKNGISRAATIEVAQAIFPGPVPSGNIVMITRHHMPLLI